MAFVCGIAMDATWLLVLTQMLGDENREKVFLDACWWDGLCLWHCH
jgi:hypothetical protein